MCAYMYLRSFHASDDSRSMIWRVYNATTPLTINLYQMSIIIIYNQEDWVNIRLFSRELDTVAYNDYNLQTTILHHLIIKYNKQ